MSKLESDSDWRTSSAVETITEPCSSSTQIASVVHRICDSVPLSDLLRVVADVHANSPNASWGVEYKHGYNGCVDTWVELCYTRPATPEEAARWTAERAEVVRRRAHDAELWARAEYAKLKARFDP